MVTGLAFLLVLNASLGPQSDRPKFSLENVDHPAVAVLHFEPTAHSRFLHVFERDEIMGLQPFSFVITNQSERAILALTVRWSLTTSATEQSTYDMRTDSFFFSNQPVIPAGASLLVTPTYLVLDSMSGFMGPSLARAKYDAERFEASTAVSAALDVVVLADGEVLGPDESNSIAFIEARRKAAENILKAFEDAPTAGHSPDHVLSGFLRSRPRRDDFVGVWSVRLAARLRDSPDIARDLDALARLPKPRFYRNTD